MFMYVRPSVCLSLYLLCLFIAKYQNQVWLVWRQLQFFKLLISSILLLVDLPNFITFFGIGCKLVYYHLPISNVISRLPPDFFLLPITAIVPNFCSFLQCFMLYCLGFKTQSNKPVSHHLEFLNYQYLKDINMLLYFRFLCLLATFLTAWILSLIPKPGRTN